VTVAFTECVCVAQRLREVYSCGPHTARGPGGGGRRLSYTGARDYTQCTHQYCQHTGRCGLVSTTFIYIDLLNNIWVPRLYGVRRQLHGDESFLRSLATLEIPQMLWYSEVWFHIFTAILSWTRWIQSIPHPTRSSLSSSLILSRSIFDSRRGSDWWLDLLDTQTSVLSTTVSTSRFLATYFNTGTITASLNYTLQITRKVFFSQPDFQLTKL
jgi:hypothetical protein